jgi:DHA2 family multidrug resistance protein
MMTAATGLYNVINQVFGSIGIAVTATLLSWGQMRNRSVLMEHINLFRDHVADWLKNFSDYLYSRGMDPIGAGEQTLRIMEGYILRHSAMISYNYIYFILGVIFFIALPLSLLLKDQRIVRF